MSLMVLQVWQDFMDWSWSPVVTAAACGYAMYYLCKVVHRPKLYVKSGPYEQKLIQHLKVLEEYYWPTFWCFTSHMQTIFRAVCKSKPFLPYRREYLSTPDDGQLALDWVDNDTENSVYPNPQTRPTILILPGITGCSDTSYARHLVLEAKNMGYRTVVFNNRGLGKDVRLKTPRTFCACNADDLEHVLSHIKKDLPDSPLFIFAVSLGGVLLTNYLCQAGKPDVDIAAAMTVSMPMDSRGTTESLERPLNWCLYNRHVVSRLKRLLRNNLHVFEEKTDDLPFKLDDVMKARTIREFDEHFTSKSFGFENLDHYYRESSISLKPLENIKVPMVFLNSTDDPFAPGETLPIDLIIKNPNLAVILTEYGGHIGFVEGMFIRDRSFVERLFFQYASCMLTDIDSSQATIGVQEVAPSVN